MSSRARIIGPWIAAAVVAAIVIFLIGQSMRISLDVPLARSASQVLYHKFDPKDGNGTDAYVLDIDTGTITQITTNYRTERATWSPDGESIILSVGDKGRLELLPNGQTRSLPDSEGYYRHYSPDQTYFVYDDCPYDTGGAYGWHETESVFVVETANPTNVQEIKNACFANWSPQGDQLVFTSKGSDDVDPELYIANRDGSNRRRVVTNVGADSIPQWSADGVRLATRTLLKSETVKGEQLHLVDAHGQNLVLIDDFSWSWINAFGWSPDGQTLLYANGADKLCVVRPDAMTPACSDKDISGAVWSPDGTQVAYKEEDWTICVMDPITLIQSGCFPGTEGALILSWRPA